jgi:hypothetical protein
MAAPDEGASDAGFELSLLDSTGRAAAVVATDAQRRFYTLLPSGGEKGSRNHFSHGIYHHSFFFTPDGQWCVVQQGMNEESRWARRYHWLAETVDDFVCEPHAAVRDLADAAAGPKQLMLLNMVAQEAGENRRASAALVRENPDWLLDQIEQYTEGPTLFAPRRHPVLKLDINQKRQYQRKAWAIGIRRRDQRAGRVRPGPERPGNPTRPEARASRTGRQALADCAGRPAA